VSGLVLSGASVSLQATTDFSNTNGKYFAGTATAGSYQAIYMKAGYLPDTFTVALTNGVTVLQDVALQPVQQVSLGLTVRESWYPFDVIQNAKVDMSDGSGLVYNFTSNATGQISSTIAGTSYEIIAGKWGYITQKTNGNAAAGYTGTIYLDQGYYDDAYFNYGWTQSGSAPRGNWERGEPQGTFTQNGVPANPEDDATNDIGNLCFVTGNGGGSVGDDDVDNGTTTFTSPVMDLTTYVNPVITYSWWMFNADLSNQGAINDHYKIILSNGTQTVTVKDYTGMHNSWLYDSINIGTQIPLTATMRIALEVTDTSPGHVLEGAFDKLFVKGAPNTNNVSVAPAWKTSVSLYPNPVTDKLSLEYDVEGYTQALHMEILDVQGRVLATHSLTNSKGTTVFAFPYPSGSYWGILKGKEGVLSQFSIVKK
jgi:hypothetical protein